MTADHRLLTEVLPISCSPPKALALRRLVSRATCSVKADEPVGAERPAPASARPRLKGEGEERLMAEGSRGGVVEEGSNRRVLEELSALLCVRGI